MPAAAETPDPVQFEAMITPHRSLTLAGLRILIGVVLASCVVTSVVFTLAGAWPVGVFAGLELVLAAILFRLHARAARDSELLLLSQTGLRIIRTAPNGQTHTSHLTADWLNVRLQEHPGRVPSLLLLGHGTREEIGRALGADAKRELADALAQALDRRRNPRFDNPQLR